MVRDLPATQETWVQSPGREDPLEKGPAATHSSILDNSLDREPGRLQSIGVAMSWTLLRG